MAEALADQLQREAQTLETYARSAFGAIGARAAYWRTLTDAATQYGVLPAAIVGTAIAGANEYSDKKAAQIGGVILDLFDGRSEIVPCRIAGGPVFFAVRQLGSKTGELGVIAIALRVLQYASAAAFAAFGWQLGDFYLEVRKTEADAVLLQAQTASVLAFQAKLATDPKIKAALADAAARASQAAADAKNGGDWYDPLLRAIGTAGAAAGSAWLLWLGLAWAWGRRDQAASAARRGASSAYRAARKRWRR